MSFQNFIDSFTRGFGFGMLYSNPFFGCCNYYNPCLTFNPFMCGGFHRYPDNIFGFPTFPQITAPKFEFTIPSGGSNISSQNTNESVFNFDFSGIGNTINQPAFSFNSSNTNSNNSSVSDTFTSSSKNKKKTKQTVSSNPEATKKGGLVSKKWNEMTDSEMKQVYGNYDYDVTKPYAGSAGDLNKYLKGKGKLEGQGEIFLKAQQKYGISATALIGICCHESGMGKHLCASNNVAGVRKFTSKGKWEWRKFSSIEECVMYVASFLKSSYVDNPGNGKVNSLTKLYQINAKYCPGAEIAQNANWASKVQKYAKEAEIA